MSQDDSATVRVTTLQILQHKKRLAAAKAIADGRLPTIDDIYSGLGFAGGDWKQDCALWCADLLIDDAFSEYLDIIEHAKNAQSRPALEALREICVDEGWTTSAERCDVYLTALGDFDAYARVVAAILGVDYGRPSHHRTVFGIGLARSRTTLFDPPNNLGSARAIIKSTAAALQMQAAVEAEISNSALQDLVTETETLIDVISAVVEDRAEIDPTIPAGEGLIVVPASAASATAKSTKKDILAGYVGIIGAPIPWVKAPEMTAVVDKIRAQMPHTVDAFLRVVGPMQAGDPVHIRPTLLVGEPGTGKSTMARIIAEVLGVPFELHGMGGASDSSLMGTSAQWHSARENVVLQLIKRTKTCNPVVCWDEIEKAGTSRHNGAAVDAMLPLLETHTAKIYRDPALEIEVDLSMVSHIATANSLSGIPRPLLDRFNIVKMPEPEWQHVGVLSRGILDKIAKERGLDRRWFPDLAGDELEALKPLWNGGSIRRLEKILRRMMDGRDGLMGRG